MPRGLLKHPFDLLRWPAASPGPATKLLSKGRYLWRHHQTATPGLTFFRLYGIVVLQPKNGAGHRCLNTCSLLAFSLESQGHA